MCSVDLHVIKNLLEKLFCCRIIKMCNDAVDCEKPWQERIDVRLLLRNSARDSVSLTKEESVKRCSAKIIKAVSRLRLS